LGCWYNETIRLIHMVKCQPALIAQPASIYFGIPPGYQAKDRAVSMIDPHGTACGASRANAIGTVQEPDSHLESEIPGGECPDWADVNHVTRVRIIEWAILKSPNRDVIASAKKLHLSRGRYVFKKPDTA